MSGISRRQLLQDSTIAAAGATVVGRVAHQTAHAAPPATQSATFQSGWQRCFDRPWPGPEYWANPLQDWRIQDGRIECVKAAGDRNVHLLTRDLGPQQGTLAMSVRVGRVEGKLLGGKGSAGFRIGIEGPLREYRNNLVHANKGLNAGITSNGGLFIGSPQAAKAGAVETDAQALELRLTAEPAGEGYTVTLSAHGDDGNQLAQVRRENVPAAQLVGNVALVANFGSAQRRARGGQAGSGPGLGRFWFSDWTLGGSKLAVHEDRAYGPILFSQYTLSEGVMTMTAQMAPVGAQESQEVLLQVKLAPNADWTTREKSTIHPQARTATFRISGWDDGADVPYRLVYSQKYREGSPEEYEWTGTIRRDPVDEPVLTVADISCNIHAAFPNHEYVALTAKTKPDFLAFVGDQFYESTGGYGVTREPLEPAILDYLRKWSMHGWTWRELMRDRPSISIPDDHDVYQGNIWGESGAPREGTQEMGGYDMHPEWVNVVHRTQTSHHPAPYDPTPIKQNISVYYGPLRYGRVSFAILADRMFKTGPEGVVPPTSGRGDHVTDPNFDPKTADVPGAELLGEKQLQFVKEWAADWTGADMKAVLSQTIFTAMATTHGGNRERLRADYDANGWPQSQRNAALREIRKAFAVHLAGDQHLPAVVHYGIDEHGDAGVAFAGPAINVGYPRWFEPEQPGQNRKPGAPENTGEFLDHFGNRMTVLAVANGAVSPRRTPIEAMRDKASGLGIVRFDKRNQTVTIGCWPYLADPTDESAQFPGWPIVATLRDNYGRKAAAHLPVLQFQGIERPVVQVVAEATGEIVYTLRVMSQEFQPFVFEAGKYTVHVSEPETGRLKTLEGLTAAAENSEGLRIEVP